MIHLYGIANCDTVRKARKWLAAHDVEYVFHDYRKEGVDRDWLKSCCDKLGWETLLNRRGTTWRQLAESEREDVDEDKALTLMLAHPSMIRRPLLVAGDRYLSGFSPERYEAFFS